MLDHQVTGLVEVLIFLAARVASLVNGEIRWLTDLLFRVRPVDICSRSARDSVADLMLSS
jgi:hypothetical protein